MGLLTLEHSTLLHRADIALYGAGVVGLAAFLVEAGPRAYLPIAAFWAVVGWVAWSAIEYALHRFVLHGVQPFRRWHEAHHQRPAALIGAP
ncbi:MAG TPA: hypothetical protein VNU71_15920, partial [Burkholderiaceae bacterium]|nr:hypothetical protein [Burkholderiaceae bacterium]